MKRLTWASLPNATKGRLIEAARGNGAAAALFFVPFRPRPAIGARLFLLAVSTLAVLYSWIAGFGVPQNPDAMTSGWIWPAIALGMFGYAFAAFVSAELSKSTSGIQAGTYIFATHCIEIVRDTLTVRPLDALQQFDARPVPGGIAVVLRFPKDFVRLSVDRGGDGEKRLATCASVLRAAGLARQRGDWAWLAARDPIGDVDRLGGPQGGAGLSIEGATRMASICVGIVLAAIAAPLRTLASDAAVVHSIQLAPSSAAWRWYIGAGGRQAAEAQATWLPAAVRVEDDAAFQAAIAAGTAQALRDYLRKFEIHAVEVRDSELPQAALREAVASGSIARLRAFLREFGEPAHARFRDDAAREIAARYAQALVTLEAQVPPKDRDLRLYFERLFAWLSQSADGRMDVVFAPPATANLAATDRLYRRGYAGTCGSVASLETNFGTGALAGSQTKVFDALTRSFKQIVSNEALELVESDGTDASRPAIRVAYTVTSSGTVFVDEKETDAEHASECFVGTRIKFDVRMTIPGERTRYTFSVNVLPPEHFEVSEKTASWMPAGSAASAGQVYSVMTGLAFESLAEGLRQRLFSPSSSAYDEMFQMLDSATQ